MTLIHPIFKGNDNDDMFIEFGGGKIRKIIWDLNDNNDVILSKYITNDVRNDNNIGYDSDIYNNKCDDITLEYNEYINGYRIGYNIIGNIKGLQFNTNINNKYTCGTFNNLDYDSKLILFNNKYLSGFYYNNNNNAINKISFQFNQLTNDITSLHKRRLNSIFYRRVLSQIGPIQPHKDVENSPETAYDSTKLEIIINKECAHNNGLNGNKDHKALIDELLDKAKNCIEKVEGKFGYIYETKKTWLVFAKLISSEGCLSNIDVDHQAYCVSDVIYLPIMQVQGTATCAPNTNGEYVSIYQNYNEYINIILF